MSDERKPTSQDLIFVVRDLLVAVARYDKWTAEIAGVNTTDLAALSYIEEAGTPVAPKMLSDFLDISTGATTALIDRLVRRGFVERAPHPTDRRGVTLVLTPLALDGDVARLRNRFRDLALEAWQSFSHREIEIVRRFALVTLKATEKGLQECKKRADD